MLLDFLTVFFLVAGGVLLWLNFRPKRSDVILTESEPHDPHPSTSSPGTIDIVDTDVLEQYLRGVEENPAAADDQNAYANRVASALLKSKKPDGRPKR
jgi:hypothetical protein